MTFFEARKPLIQYFSIIDAGEKKFVINIAVNGFE